MNPIEAGAHAPTDAWLRLGELGGAPVLGTRVLQAKKGKPAVWRIDIDNGALPSVVAKFAPADAADLERRVYVDYLSTVDLRTPRYLGSVAEDDGVWTFVEHVGGTAYNAAEPVHRQLAAEWLGRLHRSFATGRAGSALPDVGATHYRAMLGTTLVVAAAIRSNPALGPEGRAIVDILADLLMAADEAWPSVERSCSERAFTLVHGSFSARNMRVDESAPGLCLRVFDWGAAGWGPVARDLAKLVGPSIGGDPQRYVASVGTDAGVLRLVAVGQLFRTVEHVRWAVPRLEYSWVEGPLSTLSRYVGQLRGLIAGRTWLGEPVGLEPHSPGGFEE